MWGQSHWSATKFFKNPIFLSPQLCLQAEAAQRIKIQCNQINCSAQSPANVSWQGSLQDWLGFLAPVGSSTLPSPWCLLWDLWHCGFTIMEVNSEHTL